ncbi:ribonuclease HIII [Candidatus Margulisiibacteriota bacterium]
METKFTYYQKINNLLSSYEITVSSYQEINYGLQFKIENNNGNGVIRIYESKKGIKIDFSQIKNSEFCSQIENYLSALLKNSNVTVNSSGKSNPAQKSSMQGFDSIIGIDESGKGDYFGPLSICACYVDQKTASTLQELGITDSKKLNDNQIMKLAKKIKSLCPYAKLVLIPKTYNEKYAVFQNLNKLLAWGHAFVLEKLLEKVECKHALSDKFAHESLIQKELMEKGKKITLIQQTKAESNLAVAAASIMARDYFLAEMDNLRNQYIFDFPKGASLVVNTRAKIFVEEFGVSELANVAKIHFKITNLIS